LFKISTEIERPVERVFPYFVELERVPRWYSAVQSVARLDGGPVRQGTRCRFVRRLGGVTVENVVEVSECVPNRAFGLVSLTGPTPFRYHYDLAPTETGTLVALTGEISGEGLPGPMALLSPLAETFFRRGMVQNLRALKELAEGS
jgi:uncharacterized protein YndB with AHSA1/START domain